MPKFKEDFKERKGKKLKKFKDPDKIKKKHEKAHNKNVMLDLEEKE